MTYNKAHTLQGSELINWLYMILAQQFLSLYILHGLSKHASKGNMYRQLTTDFLSLDRNQNVSILNFLHHKKWKYYATNSIFNIYGFYKSS